MASLKDTLSVKEHVLMVKKDVLKTIEDMLERNISKDWFLENSKKLCQADYADIVEERSIDNLCGYPLCDKEIKKIIKQKYHISRNKVYDVTERKNFCSNECYKASNYLKNQLHTLPLYMRKNSESSKSLKLLLDSDNYGSLGDELVFDKGLNEKQVHETPAEIIVSTNLTNMLQQDVKDCTELLDGLSIKENVYKEKYSFGEEPQGNETEELNNENCLSDQSEYEDDSQEDKSLFPEYENIQVLSNKYMPVPSSNTKKAVLIDPLAAKKVSKPSPAKLPIDDIEKILQDWFTEDTMKYLLGERRVYSIKAERLFKSLVHSKDPVHLSSIKDEYVNLCCKIDKLPDDEEAFNGFEAEIPESPKQLDKTLQKQIEQSALEAKASRETADKKPIRKKSRDPNKKTAKKIVKFASNVKPGKNYPDFDSLVDESSTSKPEPSFPLVDSLSQNTLRRQILLGKLKSVYLDILPTVDLHYRNIKEEITTLIETFSLTPTNTIQKPKPMRCIAVVLFRMLTETKLKDMHSVTLFVKLCENSLTALNISHAEIENLALSLVSPDQVLNLNKR